MKIINDKKMIDEFIEKYAIMEFFSNDMSQYFSLHKYEAGEFICYAGDSVEYLQFQVSGRCKISLYLSNGKCMLLGFGSPLSIMGDLEITNNAPLDCDVECITDVICITIPAKIVLNKCAKDPVLWYKLCKSISNKLINTTSLSAINLTYPVESRLASYLIATTSRDRNISGKSNNITTTKLVDLADLLGTSYRHLARTLNILCDKGLISRDGRAIKIENYEELEYLAGDVYK